MMKSPTVILFFWLWLAYSGLITWCSPGTFPTASAEEAVDERLTTTTFPPTETTDSPSYAYDENTETVEPDSTLPSTTSKTGRNFGSRIRGINSLPHANSVVGSNNGSLPALRPRPSPSVISYNPTNYNRVLKRRKNSTVVEAGGYRTRGSTTTTTPSAIILKKTNAFFNNYYTVNRTRFVEEDETEPETVPSSQDSKGPSQKFLVRKRPRPVTISDGLETTTGLPTTTGEAEDNTTEPVSYDEGSGVKIAVPQKNATASLSPPTLADASSNGLPDVAVRPSAVDNSISKVTSNVTAEANVLKASVRNVLGEDNSVTKLESASSEVLKSNVSKPSLLPFPTELNGSRSSNEVVKLAPTSVIPSRTLSAEPVSHVPVFEYNPSVTVKDGVYRFRYSEPTYSSKRVHKEDFGVSHVSYGDDDGEDDTDDGGGIETTTFSPDEGTTLPYHINIDGSEEEFTSSLPPAYRDYIGNEENPQRVPVPVREGPKEKPQDVVTVTVTHTVLADSSVSHANAGKEEVAPAPDNSKNAIRKEGNAQVNLVRPTPALPATPAQPASRNYSEIVLIHSSSVSGTRFEVTHEEHPHEGQDEHPHEAHEEHPHEVHEEHPPEIHEEVIHSSGPHGGADTHAAPGGEGGKQAETIEATSIPSPPPGGPVTSKVVTSVYFTKDEQPHYTTSSYSFTESTVYSYGHPEDHHEEDDGHDHGHAPANTVEKQQQELRPTTTSFWDTLGYQSIDILKSKTLNGSKNGSLAAEDQESGFSTPEAETELPPWKFHTTPLPDYVPQAEENEIDDGTTSEASDGTEEETGGPGIVYDEHDAELPPVPVFIQVLVDMPARIFCSRIPIFKHMVASVYAPQLGVHPSQVVVVNELNCSNVTSHGGPHHHHPGSHVNETNLLSESNIKYATTTAAVLRTISSSTARSATLPRRSNSVRVRRHEHIVHHQGELGNITDPTVDDSVNRTRGPSVTALYPVFFYLNDKNGTYDRFLTESFIHYWNSSKATDSMFFSKIKKVEMITPTQGIIGEASNNENTGIIAAITIASIAAVCLFLLGILLLVMRHRQAQSKFAKRCTPVSLDDYSLDNISVYNSFRRKQRNRASKRSYTNAGFDDPNAPSRPCNAAALTSILTEPAKLEDEFQNLPVTTPTLDDIPAGAETKNRYANVIPIPDTRVLLTFQEDVPNSDYINANFVRGPMGTGKGYIITQGPLEETIVDFWRMVWEQQVRVVMMLTDFSEAGIPKCAEYYPRSETVDSSQLHGDFQITLEKRDITDNCITSYLVIKDMERNLRRDVIHLWYHSWPEKGVPGNPKSTIDFLQKSRKFTKEQTPVLVHCSNGTGRSGTLVACDICMREWDTQHSVNIPRTVMKIRQDRAGAVQTKEQYMHIYQVLQSYASRLSVSRLDSI